MLTIYVAFLHCSFMLFLHVVVSHCCGIVYHVVDANVIVGPSHYLCYCWFMTLLVCCVSLLHYWCCCWSITLLMLLVMLPGIHLNHSHLHCCYCPFVLLIIISHCIYYLHFHRLISRELVVHHVIVHLQLSNTHHHHLSSLYY
jgi:hypothetical protein